ncbi:Integrase catalytic region (fragment) [Pseudodesulfovibrio profundus]|uniref:Integrase catalytic region n=1 Tax=Pseudodesulfovibrio profundus TaxID=57320 RepID=A0A2C8FE81_9BACT
MQRTDELFMELPFFDSRQIRNILRMRDSGPVWGRRLMRKKGLMAIYKKPNMSHPYQQH